MSGETLARQPGPSADEPPDLFLDLVRDLQRARRARDAHGLFFIEGVRNFVRAADHSWPFERLLVSQVLLKCGVARKLAQRLKREGIPVLELSPESFRSVSQTPHASGVAAVLRQRVHRLHELNPRQGRCWLVVQQIRSPGNLGTLLRTSAAAGGAGLILVGGKVDAFEPGLIRASMGAFFEQPIACTGVPQLRDWIRRHRLQVVGATPDAPVTHFETHFRTPTLLVLGEERKGLQDELVPLCDQLVRIPMQDGIDSLNVAVAGSLLMYEVLRSSRRLTTGKRQRR